MTTIKTTEIIETVACLQIKIDAEGIHPCILKGLIPVSTPCFLDAFDRATTCKTFKFDRDIYIQEVYTKLLSIVATCINLAKENNCEYLYHILISEKTNGITVTVRGA